jgi:GNAT superfamily N-acetyltransferase
VQAEEQTIPGISLATATLVRRLHAPDEPLLAQFVLEDRGYALFIASNMRSYGIDGHDLRFWGQFRGQHTVDGALMLAGHNGNLFVRPGADPMPLIATALRERLHFVMGATDVMGHMQAHLGDRVGRVEVHHFAELPAHRFHASPAPDGVTVRQGVPRDVDALARLYFNTSGFEDLSYAQLRNTMMHRLSHLRTFLAETHGRVVAAASTSAEAATTAMIGGVWTAPVLRGQGIASAVVAALCADLLRDRLRPHLFYLTDNAPAARVYANIGFRLSGGWKVIYCAS